MQSFEELENEERNKAPIVNHKKNRTKAIMAGTFFFFFFLLMKLPEPQIQKLAVAHIKIESQKQGYLFSTEKMKIGIFTGLSLKFYNIELTSLNDDKVKLLIPFLKVKPHLFSLLPFSKTKKLSVTIELQEGDIDGTVGTGANTIVDLDFSNVKLDKLIAFAMPQSPVTLQSAILDGSVQMNLDNGDVKNSVGEIDLKLDKVVIPSQTLMGMILPKLSIEQSKIELSLSDGRFSIKNLSLGKDIKKDDLVATFTGDATLGAARAYGSFADRITTNFKVAFLVSENLKKGVPLIESFIGSAKGADGKYHYKLNGPLSSPFPTPGQ